MLLTPTVAPDGDYGLISVRGISGLYNNNTVDGADNNQAFFSEARGRTRVVYTLSQAAIKEFQVGISNFSAEHGRAVGGTVNAVTKSGGNALHGEAFYYIRDDAFNAQEPFNKAEGFNLLPERRQQFGFSMGGPVKQDKVFWYLNYDQQVRNFPGVAINEGNNLTDPAETPCDIPNVPGRCDAARAFLLSQLGIFSRKGHNNVALGKIDWNISPSQSFSVQYNYHKWRSPNGIQTQARTNDTALANGFDGVRTDMLLFRLTSLPTASTVNEFRFQYGRDFEFQRNNAPGPFIDLLGDLNIDTGMREFLPRIAFPNEKRFQLTDNFSWVRGKHMIKFGADINYVREEMINLYRGGAEFEFYSFENYARDVPLPGLPQDPDGAFTGMHYGNFYQAFDVTTGGIGRIFFTTTDWNFYVHDTFKVHPHLTMNFGLRYEYADLPQPDQSIFATPSAEFASLPAAIQAQAQRLNNDTNNFGPRVALAWDIGGKQKMVLRAGYGLYYGRTSNSALAAGLFESNAITRFSIRLRPGLEADAPVFPNTFCTPALGTPGVESVCTPPGATGGVALNLFTEDFVRPLIHSTEFELEYALTPNTSISASYLGTRGQRLPAFIDRNLNAPTDTVTVEDNNGQVMGVIPFFEGPRPFSQLGGIIQSESVVNSWYNAFVLRVRRRLSQGLQFDSHLTISKALDDGQTSTTFFTFYSQRVNPFDGANEYGLSNFDISKKWVSHFYWDPPFERIENKGVRNAFEGFKFSGIVTLRDGRAFPANVSMGSMPYSLYLGWNAVSSYSVNGTGADSRLPTIGRNPFTTTNFANVDFRVTREFTITEGTKAVFIWEAFNLFNRVNFNQFRNGAFFGSSDCVQSGGFGSLCLPDTRTVTLSPRSNFLEPTAASNTLSGPRQMQFAFKFIW